MSTLDQTSGVTLPPLEGAAEQTEEGTEAIKLCLLLVHTLLPVWFLFSFLLPVLIQSTNTNKEENPYVSVLACWVSQEEADTESSNEEEDTGASPAPSGADGRIEGDPASNPSSNTNKYVHSTTINSKYVHSTTITNKFVNSTTITATITTTTISTL